MRCLFLLVLLLGAATVKADSSSWYWGDSSYGWDSSWWGSSWDSWWGSSYDSSWWWGSSYGGSSWWWDSSWYGSSWWRYSSEGSWFDFPVDIHEVIQALGQAINADTISESIGIMCDNFEFLGEFLPEEMTTFLCETLVDDPQDADFNGVCEGIIGLAEGDFDIEDEGRYRRGGSSSAVSSQGSSSSSSWSSSSWSSSSWSSSSWSSSSWSSSSWSSESWSSSSWSSSSWSSSSWSWSDSSWSSPSWSSWSWWSSWSSWWDWDSEWEYSEWWSGSDDWWWESDWDDGGGELDFIFDQFTDALGIVDPNSDHSVCRGVTGTMQYDSSSVSDIMDEFAYDFIILVLSDEINKCRRGSGFSSSWSESSYIDSFSGSSWYFPDFSIHDFVSNVMMTLGDYSNKDDYCDNIVQAALDEKNGDRDALDGILNTMKSNLFELVSSASFCESMLENLVEEAPDLMNMTFSFINITQSEFCTSIIDSFDEDADFDIEFPSSFPEESSYSWSSFPSSSYSWSSSWSSSSWSSLSSWSSSSLSYSSSWSSSSPSFSSSWSSSSPSSSSSWSSSSPSSSSWSSSSPSSSSWSSSSPSSSSWSSSSPSSSSWSSSSPSSSSWSSSSPSSSSSWSSSSPSSSFSWSSSSPSSSSFSWSSSSLSSSSFPWSSSSYSWSSSSWWWSSSSWWWGSSYEGEWNPIDPYVIERVPIEIWIQLAGRIYQADNLREGALIFCETVPDALMDRVATEMCQALDDENFYEFLKLCYQVSHEDDYDDWEDWEDWDDYLEDIFLEGLFDTIPYALNISDNGPYELCNSYTNLYSLDNDGIKEKANGLISAIAHYSSAWLYSTTCWRYYDWRHFWPSSWSSSWSSEVSYSFDESSTLWWYKIPEIDSLDNVLSVIFRHLGDWNSEEQMCQQMASLSGDPDISQEDLYDFLDNMVDSVLDMTTNLRSCRNFVNEIINAEILTSEALEKMTGYSSASDVCSFVVETFSANKIRVGAVNLPDVSEYSYVEDYLGYLGEQAFESGMILPLIPFETAVKMIAKMYNADNFPEMSETFCDVMEQYMTRVHGMSPVESLCRIFSRRGSEQQDLISECEEIIVPVYYGPDYPLSLRPFDLDKFFEFITDTFEFDTSVIEEGDPQGVCVEVGGVIKEVLISDQSILDVVRSVMVDVGLWVIDEYGLAFCDQIEEVRDYVEELQWWDNYGQWWYWDSSAEDFHYFRDSPRVITQETLDVMDDVLGVITGMGSLDRVCDSMVDGRDDLEEFMERMAGEVIGLLENVDRCERFVDTMEELITSEDLFEGEESSWYSYWDSWGWWSSSAPFRMDIDDILNIIGFEDRSDMCLSVVQAFTQEVVEECKGIVDCAGECNGPAREDCAGVCNGDAKPDCAGECDGDAYINYCFECVGGRTNRDDDFGADRCGLCKQAKDYKETWDCSGSCNATAFYDKCGECVGGDSGLDEDANDDRLDCRGVCDGDWVEDTCDFCEPYSRVNYTGGSKYMDCSSTCVTPGFPRAQENDCGECYGGNTGLEIDEGINACGQCDSDPSADEQSCAGCDGVPASGEEYDACGTCGGDGSDCVGVLEITPNVLPNKATKIHVVGAGFSSDASLSCVFIDNSGEQYEAEIGDLISYFELECTTPALDAGEYDLAIKRNSDSLSEFRQSIYVYEDISFNSISPTEALVTKVPRLQTFEITAPSGSFSDFMSLSDYNVIPSVFVSPEDDPETVWMSAGTFTNDRKFTVDFILPTTSGRFFAFPSINGQDSLIGDEVTLTAYWSAPTIDLAQFSSTGAFLWVEFGEPVHYYDLGSCDDIFEDVDGLGKGAWCIWAGPMKLVVIFGTGNNLFSIGDSLTLKNDSVYAFLQDYSYAANGSVAIQAPDTPLIPTAFLSGPSKIPSCGNLVLNGRKSTGSGARPLIYEWSVSASTVDANLTDALDTTNAAQGGYGFADLVLDGSLLTEADEEYDFTLNVTNFLGQSDSASLTVVRSATLAPEVNIQPRGVDVDYVKVADMFYLVADIKYYSECVPAGETVIEWSVNNTDVALNLFTMYTRALRVDEGSLPGGENILFTVTVYKSSTPNQATQTSILVTTHQSDLIAKIDGAKEFIVGRDSGTVSLDGTNSIDPDEQARDWEYTWLCEQTTDNSACWSFDPDSLGSLIVNTSNNDVGVLEFDAQALEAEKTYVFTLVVRKETRTAQTFVTISAVNGNPPKIILFTSDEDNIINDDVSLELTAYIFHSSDLSTYSFQTVDTTSGYSYIDLTDSSNLLGDVQLLEAGDGFSIATITIDKGIVQRGASYAFLLNVTDIGDQYSTVKSYVEVRSGPTSCEFSVPSYEELDEVIFTTENCVTSVDAYPLNYQLSVVKADGELEIITEKNSEPSFTGVGKPKLEGSDNRTYVITVCDKNEMCATWIAGTNVSLKLSFSAADINSFKADFVNAKTFAGDHIGALANRNMLASKVDESASRRRRVASDETSATAAEQMVLIANVLSNTVLDTTTAQILIDQIAAVSPAQLTLADQDTFLGYILQIVNVYVSEDVTIPDSSAESILYQLATIGDGLTATDNGPMLNKINKITSKITTSMTGALALGAPRQEIISADVTVGVMRALLTGSFESASSGSGAATIDFGSELNSLYGSAWDCADGETCSGVTITFSHYSTSNDPFSMDQDDVDNRAADIIGIELSNPSTGSTLNVSGLTTPVTISFPLTISLTGVSYGCVYWDSDLDDWSTDGMTSTTVDDSTVSCESTHLTEFTIMGTPVQSTAPPSTTAQTDELEGLTSLVLYIAIGCAAGFIILIFIVILLICMVMKINKRSAVPSTSIENGQSVPPPPPPQNSMADPMPPAYGAQPLPSYGMPPPTYAQRNPYNDIMPPTGVMGPLDPPPVALVGNDGRVVNGKIDTTNNPLPKGKMAQGSDNSYLDYMNNVVGRPGGGGMPGVDEVTPRATTSPRAPSASGSHTSFHH
ncbi:uncharacterized protein LOC129264802 [Lytechinus pictus]|uniref:uncharacterized protein LOC129264802 n=1 Tax=Lytechinus pictus TaxID=7653 RepID=UPI0030B9AF71